MERRELGTSRLQVSIVGLGCNNFGYMSDDAAERVIRKALDLGVTLFDTADAYGLGVSEQNLGKALGANRHQVVIATKFGMRMGDGQSGASRSYVRAACEASLRRLGTDWIDLYQLHRPDPGTPIEETMQALHELVIEGKVRAVGCSNHPAWQVVEANRSARALGCTTFMTAQDEYSLLERGVETDLIPALNAQRMSLLPYFPLASGLLTGKYLRGVDLAGTRLSSMKGLAEKYMTETNWRIVAALTAFAACRGRTLLELAFGWLRSRAPVASIIAGATRVEQIEANVAAAGWMLTPEELAEADALTSRR